ncbi:NAD(P)/FAD-dependent oxidoreductase [Planctomyces sp. SH-PL62]|uniref:NAD(P)/FAD-dependent oxidoreductase n=1 Tax=Planctomyces sp. SH-PL62 TaxID=1636152 RepID=UPI00078D9527|nr:tryptophan 7-halogenase [Planctomyces sp. SH-PL62]AMV40967.1 Putative FAD-dependent oxidoreductase LodB [Planctomyces sp. SH-PL62]
MSRPRPPSASYAADVAVLGGGPTGAAAAIALAEAGRSVVVVERSRYDSARVGEALPPEVRTPLAELGVWDRFLACGPSPSPGVAYAWGEHALKYHDFILNPVGPGWAVDRARFDAMLAAAAAARGARVLTATRPLSLGRGPAGGWTLVAASPDGPIGLRARALVDATGRASSPVRRLGGGRLVVDRLVGLVAFLEASGMEDRGTLVEAAEDGWWYTAPIPGGKVAAAFMTDADMVPKGRAARGALWRVRLHGACETRGRLEGRRVLIEPGMVLANTTLIKRPAWDGRAAAGDAAATLDPLSGQGIHRALCSGLDAARAVDAHLRGDPWALSRYSLQVASDFAADLAERARFYARERRWRGRPFWERRTGRPSPGGLTVS